jgi:hypothetical protein
MKIILILLFALLTFPVWALDDTMANREQEADRYLAARPTKEVLENSVDLATKNMLPQRREAYKTLYFKYLDIDAVTKDMKDSMVTDFTADELKALADFCGTPAGKSAMNKMAAYQMDVLPKLKTELQKAEEKANQDK